MLFLASRMNVKRKASATTVVCLIANSLELIKGTWISVRRVRSMDFVGTVPLKARVFRRFVCLAPEAAGLAQCLGEHINNILKDGELEREVVCA